MAGEGFSSLGRWSRTLWSGLTFGEMVQGGERLFLLNPSYKRWWQLLHPALVTCGRETALPSEDWVLVVQMLRMCSLESPQRSSVRVVGRQGWRVEPPQ